MIVTAAQARLKIAEVPITYYPRLGESKLQYLARWLAALALSFIAKSHNPFHFTRTHVCDLGMDSVDRLGKWTSHYRKIFVDFHYMIVGSALAMLGLQILLLGLQGKKLPRRQRTR